LDLEETRQQVPAGCRQVNSFPVLQLRQVSLAQRLIHLLLHRLDDFHLRHCAAQATHITLNFTQVFDFLSEIHTLPQIAICYIEYSVSLCVCQGMRCSVLSNRGYCIMNANTTPQKYNRIQPPQILSSALPDQYYPIP